MRAEAAPTTLMQPVLGRSGRLLQTAGIAVWAVCFVYFWSWWFQPQHFGDWLPFSLVTATLLWVSVTPAYFMFIFRRSQRPSATTAIPAGQRIAMVVTKAPSEPFEIVRITLEAMLAQDVPHDTWLADERPDAETIAWCEAHGVEISTRFGVEAYHRATWPRRTRCKEGNLAYFYDHYGYERYDLVVQLDADHVPEPGYLRAMVQPFADPEVGYVSAPSICDSNAKQSWSARGRLYAEASMHGSLQAGYNRGWAPLCIGSHYAVRTVALKQIGGLGPELAEDHSTTLMMNAGGWRGVHAVDAIAHGMGPDTFADLAVQEFQWSRSLVTILLQHTKNYLAPLSPKLRFQFLFSQLWYPLFSLTMLLSVIMPIVALIFDFTFVNVPYFEFLAHFMPMGLVLIALAFAWRASGTFRPYDAKVLSWEAAVFAFARWPWAILGTIAAIADTVAGRRTEFRVTPKGSGGAKELPLSVLAPCALISFVSALTAFAISGIDVANGYYLFAVGNAVAYALVFATILIAHWVENGVARRGAPWLARVSAATMLALFPVVALTTHGLDGLEAVAWNSGVSFTEAKFSVSGAGMGGDHSRKLSFKFQWLGDQTP